MAKEKAEAGQMGRPTKYDKSVLEKTALYVTDFEKYGDAIPSIAGLSLILNISRETIHTWAKDPEKNNFSDMLKQLAAKQEQIALCKGIKGEWNSTIVKLVLAKHGYSERTEIDHTSSDKSMTPTFGSLYGAAPNGSES